MKLLITGATGFIGKNFTKRALDLGYETVCMVRQTSNIDALKVLDVSFCYARVEEEEEVKKVFSEVKPDVVVHCAAGVMQKDEELLFRVNGTGTRNVCKASLECGVKKLLHVSSIAVVGKNDMPLTDDMPYNAKNAYGRSKIEAERNAIDFRGKGLPVAIVRPCMVCGEGEPHAMDTMLRYAKKRLLPVFDVPEMESKLQLGYIGNIVDSMELALENEKGFEGTFIVADEEPLTMRRFVEIAYEELGFEAPVIPGWIVRIFLVIPFFKRQFNRIYRDRTYDISRAKELLGYEPKVSAEEGVRRTVRDWKRRVLASEGRVPGKNVFQLMKDA